MRMGVEMCQGQDVQRGCLALNTAVELGPHDGDAAALLKRCHARTGRLLAETIERGQALGEFRSDLPAKQLAKSLLVFGAGMLVTSKVLSQEEIVPAEMAEMAEFALGLLY
jgi:TetR/AcrR family transcriptional repressor of nem operon